MLIALPFGLFIMMLHLETDISSFCDRPIGIKMCVFGIVTQVVGAIVIKKIIDIKV